MASNVRTLTEAISVLMDWDYRGQVKATLRETRDGTETLSVITAMPAIHEWTIDHRDERFIERRTADGIYTATNGHRKADRFFREPDRVPPALWLVFPMYAFFWGRSRDTWRMVDAARAGDETEISLEHREHPEFQGTLTVNHYWQIATKLWTPTSKFELFDFEW